MGILINDQKIAKINEGIIPNNGVLSCGGADLLANRKFNKNKVGWAAVGDSITDFENRPNNYPYWIAQRNSELTLLKPAGDTKHGNFGVGGSTISFDRGDSIKDFFTRSQQIPDDVDMITVFGGINDWNWNVNLGTFTNVYDPVVRDKANSTFYKGMYRLAYYLKNRFPNIPILFFTPMYAKPANGEVNGGGLYVGSYAEAMKEVCAYLSIPCYDLSKNANLTFRSSYHRTHYCLDYDNNHSTTTFFHPNATGSRLISNTMEREMRKVFKQYYGKEWN